MDGNGFTDDEATGSGALDTAGTGAAVVCRDGDINDSIALVANIVVANTATTTKTAVLDGIAAAITCPTPDVDEEADTAFASFLLPRRVFLCLRSSAGSHTSAASAASLCS